jgi:hypothetical protein
MIHLSLNILLLATFAVASNEIQIAGTIDPARGIMQKQAEDSDVYASGGLQPQDLDCPANTVFGQVPSGPQNFLGIWTSDFWQGYIVYDNLVFDDLPQTDLLVCGIQFYGFDAIYTNNWGECVEDPADFLVSFYDEGVPGYPGDLIWEQVITPARTPLGINYWVGLELNQYSGELDTCITVNGGWISVLGVSQGGDPGDCKFLWLSSNEGDDSCWQYGYNNWYFHNNSMNFCLLDSTATAVYENAADLPQAIAESRNYPNPFNSRTEILYFLPEQARISIDIFDILGRKIRTLEEGLKPAGDHRAVWNAGDQVSGIYFYRISTRHQVQVKKMMLIK